MTSIIPRHHYVSLHGADDDHYLYDQYGSLKFTDSLTQDELNLATGIYVEYSTSASTNFNGAHRFSLKQASDWYYKLKGWRFNGGNYYFDYRSFDTRLANLQTGMIVSNNIGTNSAGYPSIGSFSLPDNETHGFWGKHLGFFYQQHQKNGVYDYCPYFLSLGRTISGSLRYPKNMSNGSYHYEAGDQTLAEAEVRGNVNLTATTQVKEFEIFGTGGGTVRTYNHTETKTIGVRKDLMYSFTPNSRYNQLEVVFAYAHTENPASGQTISNHDIVQNLFVSDIQTLVDMVQSEYGRTTYYLPLSYFNNASLYPGVEGPQLAGAIQATKNAYMSFDDGSGQGAKLGVTYMSPGYINAGIIQEEYHGVPVYKHYVGGASGISFSPLFD